MPALQLQYRPKNFDEFIGNKDMIASLKTVAERDDDLLPHAWLFCGPKGCGKTTLGRIISEVYLGCEAKDENPDYTEINCGSNGKIETVREIEKQARYNPIKSKNRVFILDECFVPGTKIKTLDNEKNIEDIKPGDIIYSLNGEDEVIAISKNKINLNRLIKLKFSNGIILYTTKDHLFFTNKGWVPAKNLSDHLTFSYHMLNISLNKDKERKLSNERNKVLQDLWNSYSKMANILFKRMYGQKHDERKACMQDLWRANKKTWKQILFSKMRKRKFKKTSRISGWNVFEKSEIKSRQINKENVGESSQRRNKKNWKTSFKENEEKQSYAQAKEYKQNDRNKKNKWYIKYLGWKAWWEWALYRTTNSSGKLAWVGDGICNIAWSENSKLSNLLQGRYSKQKIEDSYRSRWENSQLKISKSKRSKKREQINRIRLESSEIYKRGNNDESFKSIIGNKERNQDYVICYDLQVKNHPSYFANGLAVHNCHMLGSGGSSEKNPAQNALLKILEDTPKKCHIILCTTDPQRLLGTIHSRCHTFKVNTLSDKEMKFLIEKILSNEEILDFPSKVIDAIIDAADGHPREALKILDQIIDLEESAMLGAINGYESIEAEIKELIDCLLNRSSWIRTREIIDKLKKRGNDAEQVRRAVVNYITIGIMMKNKSNKMKDGRDIFEVCMDIYDVFRKPTYNNGWADIIGYSFQLVI